MARRLAQARAARRSISSTACATAASSRSATSRFRAGSGRNPPGRHRGEEHRGLADRQDRGARARQHAVQRRAQQHDAGPVDVRCGAPPRRRQPAVRRDLRAHPRGDPAGHHGAPDPRVPHRQRHLFGRHPRRLHQAGVSRVVRRADPAGRPRHLDPAPMAAGRQCAHHPRGHHRPAPERGQGRLHGAPRPVDRARQPLPVHGEDRGGGRAPAPARRGLHGLHARPRPVQGRQRFARPPGGRRAAQGDGATPARLAARDRRAGAPRRGRVRDPAGRRAGSARGRDHARRQDHRADRQAVRARRRQGERGHQHRHRARAAGRRRSGRAPEEGRPRALPHQIRRPQRLQLLQSGDDRRGRRTASAGERAARRAGARAVRDPLPAGGRHDDARAARRRGADPLAPSHERTGRAGSFHLARRGHRADRPARRLDPAEGMLRRGGLAAAHQALGQPVAGPVPQGRPVRPHPVRAGRHRPAARAAGDRDHRVGAAGERVELSRGAPAAEEHRHLDRAGRLRHRLFVARLSHHIPGGQDQDRQVLHPGAAAARRLRRRGGLGAHARARPRHHDHGGRRRDRGAMRDAAGRRREPGAGLAVRPPCPVAELSFARRRPTNR